jgi:hypothetical protein
MILLDYWVRVLVDGMLKAAISSPFGLYSTRLLEGMRTSCLRSTSGYFGGVTFRMGLP